MNEHNALKIFWKTFTVLDAMYAVTRVKNTVQQTAINKSWEKILSEN
jgi:hypothetical protein